MYAERRRLYRKIEAFTDSKVICFVTGDRKDLELQIGPSAIDHFAAHLDRIGPARRITLILHSSGGNALTGWTIANLLRQYGDEYHVIVPYRAHSTATLIALGASSIGMTRQATLGPLDPSINGPLNPQMPGPNPASRVPVSVEAVSGYLDFVASAGVRSEAEVSKVLVDLSSRIHPLVLGNVYRTRAQMRMLGRRLMAAHTPDVAVIDKVVDFLCSDSGSHDYTISRGEAARDLGLNVVMLDDERSRVVDALHRDYAAELELLAPYDPNGLLGADLEREYVLTRGLIESVSGGSTRYLSRGRLKRSQVQLPSGQVQEVTEDRRTFDAWKQG